MSEFSKRVAAQVCPCAAVVPGRVYPVARPERAGGPEDWSTMLVREVGDVLASYGYPAVETDSPDWYALMWCLWRFVYGGQARGRHGSGRVSGADGGAGA